MSVARYWVGGVGTTSGALSIAGFNGATLSTTEKYASGTVYN